MLSCREATEMMSQRLDRRLTLRERVSLRLHFLVCEGCRITRVQFDVLHRAATAYRQHQSQSAPEATRPVDRP